MMASYRVFWASTDIGGSMGQWVGESWKGAGFQTDENGNPTHDARWNDVANYSVVDFDPADKTHVALAVQFATSDGDTTDAAVRWIVDEFGIGEADVRARIAA